MICDQNKADDSVRYYDQAKYEDKILVWVAILPSGFSNCYVVPSKMAVNQKVYLEDCLIKQLLPFIKKHHSDDWYVFWPDMVSSHYANSVQTWLLNKKIMYIPKTISFLAYLNFLASKKFK